MKVYSFRCARKDGGVSEIVCRTFIRVYSVLESAFPGIDVTCLQVLNEAFQERYEMLRSPDISGNSFLQEVVW